MTEYANIVNVPVPGSPRFENDTAMAISRIRASMGPTGVPSFASLTLTGLTASKLVGTDANKVFQSISVGTGLTMPTTTISLSHLGIEGLADPNADRMFFWDDTAGASKWLSCGDSIAITDTTLDTIQGIRTTDSPTFAGLTTTGTINASAGKVRITDNDTTEPTSQSDGYIGVAIIGGQPRLYWAVAGDMYYVEGSASATITTGSPIGLLLSLTYNLE